MLVLFVLPHNTVRTIKLAGVFSKPDLTLCISGHGITLPSCVRLYFSNTVSSSLCVCGPRSGWSSLSFTRSGGAKNRSTTRAVVPVCHNYECIFITYTLYLLAVAGFAIPLDPCEQRKSRTGPSGYRSGPCNLSAFDTPRHRTENVSWRIVDSNCEGCDPVGITASPITSCARGLIR